MAIEISINPRLGIEEWKNLIATHKYGRYCEDRSLPIEASRRLVLENTREYLAKEDHMCLVSSSGGQVTGALLFKLSPWDTEHFGYGVAIIDSLITRDSGYEQEFEAATALLERFLAWCNSKGVYFASARVSALHLPVIHGFEKLGFRYIESWIYNKYNLKESEPMASRPSQLRPARPDDAALMISYSKGAFATQRFHADPYIDPKKADSLYEKWIVTTFADPKQRTAVLDVENRPTAFMSYYTSDLREYFGLQFAMWKMAVLNPDSRNKGLGTKLLGALMHYHREEGLDVIDSGLSMRNLASLNLHNKVGFRVVATVVSFHRWMK